VTANTKRHGASPCCVTTQQLVRLRERRHGKPSVATVLIIALRRYTHACDSLGRKSWRMRLYVGTYMKVRFNAPMHASELLYNIICVETDKCASWRIDDASQRIHNIIHVARYSDEHRTHTSCVWRTIYTSRHIHIRPNAYTCTSRHMYTYVKM
jgi:hypothetical protein